MRFLYNHWYDLGALLAVMLLAATGLLRHDLSDYRLLLWLHLGALFLHQLEEYRLAGTFPGMLNTVLYRSDRPDRYPLNPKTAFIVNVGIGWTSYVLAAVLAETAVWLGIAVMLVSAGNVVAHTFLFNIKGRTLYNPGLFTSWLFFVPCIAWFVTILYTQRLATPADYGIGLALGIALNVFGVLKLIDWLADPDTPYRFPERNLLRRKGL